MKSKTLVATLLLGTAMGVQAQKISVRQNTINLGQVIYNQPVKAVFNLKNKGLRTLQISEVQAACGCTTASYPSSVGIGKEFEIGAVYDAKTLGHFTKQLYVYSNGSKNPLLLTLKGVVVSEKKDFAGNYPYTLGELMIDGNEVEFDDVNRGDQPQVKLHIFNASDRKAQPVFMHLPNYLSAEVSPSVIAPRRSAEAILTLDSRKLRDFGLNQSTIYLGFTPGEKVSEDKQIKISAVLLPAFQKLTATQLAQAPKIHLSTDTLNLGSFNGQKKLKGEIDITNNGKTTLEIRNLQMFSNGLEVSLNKTHIAPGAHAKLKVTAIAAQLKEQKRQPRIIMITNDPSRGKVVVKIRIN